MIDNRIDGDVKFFQTEDGGDINLMVEPNSASIEMTPGFDTMAYLCLFGGAADDSGRDGDTKNWWGNIGIDDRDAQLRSETQYALANLPAVPSNLPTVQDAAKRDLAIFLNKKIATSIEVIASIPAAKKIALKINITAQGVLHSLNFVENWLGSYAAAQNN